MSGWNYGRLQIKCLNFYTLLTSKYITKWGNILIGYNINTIDTWKTMLEGFLKFELKVLNKATLSCVQLKQVVIWVAKWIKLIYNFCITKGVHMFKWLTYLHN